MTGSGKTGLGIGLVEEAAIDGVPSIVIDPKGDLTNLLLQFPKLDAASFRPWVDESDAKRKGITADELASAEAAKWKKGLASWDQDGARIQRLLDAVDIRLYTPGSTAATPVSVLASFAAPSAETVADPEQLAERTSAVVSSLLSLLGLDADPIQSRDHVLLSTILRDAWTRGESPDLAGLIRLVQAPPVQRIGVIELESFYPGKERFELAMKMNGLAASPRFQSWLTGEPLDPGAFLYGPDGKPRVSVFSIAHLSDEERMFFVTLLLDRTIGWMRSRPGTGSLRALIYMDEVFGYLPPTANPPSKVPLLTLLKQARAYGVGLVLSTQNPVDLDYKALSNAGTWFIGRLQTERDRDRLIAGLTGAASGALDADEIRDALSKVGKRVFLAHNVHEGEPVIFQTRWVLSYLAGPLTRPQLQSLAALAPATSGKSATAAPTPAPPAAARPVLAPGVPETFLSAAAAGVGVADYEATALAEAEVRYRRPRSTEEIVENVSLVAWLDAGEPDWSSADPTAELGGQLTDRPVEPATFGALPPAANDAKSWPKWEREVQATLARDRRLTVYRNKTLKLDSQPGETERDFRIRIAELGRESRDEAVDKLKERYGSKLATLDERIRKAEAAVDREADQARAAGLQTAVSVGTTLLSAFLGRKATKTTISKAATAARGATRTAQQASDVGRAKENVEALTAQRAELAAEFEKEVAELGTKLDAQAEEIEAVELAPRRTDVHVKRVTLLWVPRGASLPPPAGR
ncbi:MAG: ATP-binding protein, partial [Gemmatimonadetes bacterium]|nr:ATP-binding protein [Gemmatimonadota bacterium]